MTYWNVFIGCQAANKTKSTYQNIPSLMQRFHIKNQWYSFQVSNSQFSMLYSFSWWKVKNCAISAVSMVNSFNGVLFQQHFCFIVKRQIFFFLTLIDGLHEEMKTPCVVFTGHPSLRVGNVVHFLELWGGSSSNTIIITGNLRFQNLLLNLLQKHVCKNDITIARKCNAKCWINTATALFFRYRTGLSVSWSFGTLSTSLNEGRPTVLIFGD